MEMVQNSNDYPLTLSWKGCTNPGDNEMIILIVHIMVRSLSAINV